MARRWPATKFSQGGGAGPCQGPGGEGEEILENRSQKKIWHFKGVESGFRSHFGPRSTKTDIGTDISALCLHIGTDIGLDPTDIARTPP